MGVGFWFCGGVGELGVVMFVLVLRSFVELLLFFFVFVMFFIWFEYDRFV